MLATPSGSLSTPPRRAAYPDRSIEPGAVLAGPALTRLGWDERWSAALDRSSRDAGAPDDELAPRGPAHGDPSDTRGPTHRAVGRVTRVDRGRCEVLTAPGGTDLHAVSAAWGTNLERSAAADPTTVPTAGDWVVLARPTSSTPEGAWTVVRVLERRTAVVRAQVAAGSSHGQVLAANADVAAVVEGMEPDVDLGRVERLLALAWGSGARPVVVLTKADLVPDSDALVGEVAHAAPGVEVLAVSATTDRGLEPLRTELARGSTVALLGASGAGKSTLLGALVGGEEPVMAIGALRADGKGRHTTVTRELHLAAGGGAVLDTPGLRSVGLAATTALGDVFADVDGLARGCRFTDCEHRTEPGCAVLAAVASGVLTERRLDSHRALLREAERQAARTDARLRSELAGRRRAHQRAQRRGPIRP